MAKTGDTFTITLKRPHLEWGSYRHTNSRGIVYGEGYIPIPAPDAYRIGTFNSNANSITAPGIVDAACQQILDHSEIYSGVYGRASITFYAFATKTSRGIACGLQNVQKIRDGEPLGGHSRAEDDFATVEDEDFLN